jgi:hypothetical protein
MQVNNEFILRKIQLTNQQNAYYACKCNLFCYNYKLHYLAAILGVQYLKITFFCLYYFSC